MTEKSAAKVVVTGSASGIGLACYQLLKSLPDYEPIGVDVLATDSTDYLVDLSKSDELKGFSKDLQVRSVELSGLINCAAIQIKKHIGQLDYHDWVETLTLNVISPFYLLGLVRPMLRRGASVVNICSVHAHGTTEGMAAYAASKGAMLSATRAAALEFASLGVRVNAILPGAIHTGMLEHGLQAKDRDQRDIKLDALSNSVPLKSLGSTSDIAEAVEYLLSPKARYITGAQLVIDGGVLSALASERPF